MIFDLKSKLSDEALAKSIQKEEENFIVTMAYPDINAVLENCEVRDSRKKVWKAFNNRAIMSNSPILKEAVAMKNEKANSYHKKAIDYFLAYNKEYGVYPDTLYYIGFSYENIDDIDLGYEDYVNEPYEYDNEEWAQDGYQQGDSGWYD